MKYIKIMPLLLPAIGAFFLEWYWNCLIAVILVIVILILEREVLKKALKNLTFLIIFTVPLFILKIFTIREGRKFSLLFLSFYSQGISYVMNSMLRIVVLALISFIVFYILFPLHKHIKSGKYPLLDSVFMSFEIYQDILSEAVQVIRNKGKRKNLLTILDNIYRMGKK
jgi:hypothetical protein